MKMPSPKAEYQELADIANRLRIHAIRSTNMAKSGHPTSCSSIAEIIAVLFFKTMKFKVHNPKDPASDRFVLSKGHAAPILYAAWAEVGHFPVENLETLRTLYSDLEGHPTPRLKFIDVATGSLGQGLSIASGIAYVGKKIDRAKFRVYCVLGDSENSEGNVWEAATFAGHYKLDNLCAIVDVNRLGQVGPTPLAHDMDLYRKRYQTYGFHAIVVDGHNIEELVQAFEQAARTKEKPTVILAKTIKGKHFRNIEDTDGWHGKILATKAPKIIEYLESLIVNKGEITVKPCMPLEIVGEIDNSNIHLSTPPDYTMDDKVSTRAASGTALVKLAQNHPRVIVLDADLKNSTFLDKVEDYDRLRFIQCFLAEQNQIGVAIGAACRRRTIPFVSTFAAFLTRGFDQIRMGAISRCNVKFCGTHVGVSVGEDGPSQMGLEDLAMFRSVSGSTILYPSDAVSCERAIELAANVKGIVYIRLNRPETPILYHNDKIFRIGEAQIIKHNPRDKVLIIAGGVTLNEALATACKLDTEGIYVRVMDIFSIKPIDKKAIIKNAHETEGRVITVEDHYPQGGLGEAVLSAVAEEANIRVKMLAVPKIPKSGKGSELLDYFGVSSSNITCAVREFINSK